MTWLCTSCNQRLGSFPQSCIKCNKPHPRGLTCFECRDATLLTGTISAGPYHALPLQRGIQWLKFKGIRQVAPVLAELLLPELLKIAPLTQLQTQASLVPIPLHPRRQRERGFNQSQEIAAHVSALAGIPVTPLLVRRQATWTQSHLPHELRADNMATAFAINASTAPVRPLLLILDDVTTTGSTLSAAANVLATHYPTARLWGVTIARG